MFRQIVITLFLGFVGLYGIIGVIGCADLDILIIDLTDPEPTEPEDNQWIGTWALESYQGLSALEILAEYDDYDDEDWTFLDANGSTVDGDPLEQAIAAFWSGDGVTGYDGSISYAFHNGGTMEIEVVIRLQVQVEGIQGVLVGRDQIPGSYSLTGSTYTTEIFDEVETGTWQRTGDTLILNPDGVEGLTVLRKL
ncbi:hypothetical protein C6502_07095 [Candidatus Poribacteria bacterium]|nr:MAG: hypothetical protein C6502_07095 [Candidatus Poribacteria bacterium]